MNTKQEKALKQYLKDKIRLFGGIKKAKEALRIPAQNQTRDQAILQVLYTVSGIIENQTNE